MTNNLVAKLWGIKEGLTLAKSIEIINIYVESDVKEVIGLIVKEVNYDRPLMQLNSDCRKLLVEFKKYKLIHIFREAN